MICRRGKEDLVGAEINDLDAGEAADRRLLDVGHPVVVEPQDLQVGELLQAGVRDVRQVVVGQVQGAQGWGQGGEELRMRKVSSVCC